MAVDIAQLLAFAVKNNASDLHLSAGVPPMILRCPEPNDTGDPAGARRAGAHDEGRTPWSIRSCSPHWSMVFNWTVLVAASTICEPPT